MSPQLHESVSDPKSELYTAQFDDSRYTGDPADPTLADRLIALVTGVKNDQPRGMWKW